MQEIDWVLMEKRCWDVVLGPLKQIPMNLFMYIAGNAVSIIPHNAGVYDGLATHSGTYGYFSHFQDTRKLAGAAAHLADPLPVAPASHMAAGSSPSCSSSSPALCCGPGRQQRMAQVLGPCTRVGDQEEAPGPWQPPVHNCMYHMYLISPLPTDIQAISSLFSEAVLPSLPLYLPCLCTFAQKVPSSEVTVVERADTETKDTNAAKAMKEGKACKEKTTTGKITPVGQGRLTQDRLLLNQRLSRRWAHASCCSQRPAAGSPGEALVPLCVLRQPSMFPETLPCLSGPGSVPFHGCGLPDALQVHLAQRVLHSRSAGRQGNRWAQERQLVCQAQPVVASREPQLEFSSYSTDSSFHSASSY
ncbi:uncharacterized protein LOC133750960 [Lepus europaeus]|uniref:uncharacterized protein LOC133750960 n=1 Tax=Lepus europaeus TaxID=9983 RepID=UPI002B462508|nr:uncharacterized protein LOC133750960 [Lepus europaeus]